MRRWIHCLIVLNVVLVPGCVTGKVRQMGRNPCYDDNPGPIERAYLTKGNRLIVCLSGPLRYDGELRDTRHRIVIRLHLYLDNEPRRSRELIEISRQRISEGWPSVADLEKSRAQEVPVGEWSPLKGRTQASPPTPPGIVLQRESSSNVAFVYRFTDDKGVREVRFALKPTVNERPVATGLLMVPALVVDIVTSPIQFLGLVGYIARGVP